MSDSSTSDPGDNSEPASPSVPTGIHPVELQTEVEESFMEYAMSVIISRALPDARDGLKPVHRRILWSMSENGLRPDRGHVKCATVVGDVIAKYHPHGDSAVYDALVRMGQDFSLRHMLVDPHGNFGSPGDRPAAYRYTECRLSQLAVHMLSGIDEETVDFATNFDGRHREPLVLPSRFPNLLANGSQGIAVGMATNIPPHNLTEIIDATIHLLREPEAAEDALLGYVSGPDFPTGGLILGTRGIREAYRTGRGTIKVRARTHIEEDGDTVRVVVTEMPYQVSVESVGRQVQQAVENKESKELAGIRDMRDESAKGNTRLVFDLKRGAHPDVVLNNLFKHSRLQTTFPANMVALDRGIPRTMTLRQMLTAYAAHQISVLRKRSEYRLRKARERAHILEGLLRAVDMLDAVISAIRESENRAAAREQLMAEPFEFSEVQADHILDLTLGRLTRIGRSELSEEYEEKQAQIAELEKILADESQLKQVIIDELIELRETFGESRRTEIVEDPGEFDMEDLLEDDEVVFVLTAAGYAKCVLAEEFRTQGRGGVGIRAAKLNEDDDVKQIIYTSAHAYLLFFTSLGRTFRLKAYEIPRQGRESRGIPLVNFLNLAEDETVAEVIDTRDYETYPHLFFVTQKGRVKRSLLTEFDSTYKGLKAINLVEGDKLVQVMATKEDDEVMLVTKHGQAIRFALNEVRQMGRNASGVIGIRLRSGDEVVSAVAVEDDKHLLVVSTEGFGKRTEFSEFSCKHRGGYGMKGFKVVEERGEVVGALGAGEEDEILLITSSGTMIRTSVSDVSVQGRAASGVRVMRPREGDSVKAITPASPLENGEEEELAAEGIAAEAAEGADLGAATEAASTGAENTEDNVIANREASAAEVSSEEVSEGDAAGEE